MKKVSISVLLLLSALFGFSQSPFSFRADKDTIAEQQIKQLEFLLVDLLAKGDISTYATYLTDDYIRVAANGVVSTKEQVLDGLRKSNFQGKMMPHDLNVRVYGNTAILRAILEIEGNEGKKRTSVITKVFINQNGKWYMASLQGTSVQY